MSCASREDRRSPGGLGIDSAMTEVRLAEEAINQIIGQRGFEANIQTIKTADEILGTILDIKK
jgi:flagellar hook protein FlgE